MECCGGKTVADNAHLKRLRHIFTPYNDIKRYLTVMQYNESGANQGIDMTHPDVFRAVPILGGYKVVLRPGDDIAASLSAVMSEYKIKNAEVYGFGAVENVDFDSKSTKGVGSPKNLEMVSLTGVLKADTGGSPKIDLHTSFGSDDFAVKAGSFSGAKVSYSFEIFVITDPRYSSLFAKFQKAALKNKKSKPGTHEIDGGFELALGPEENVWDKLNALMEAKNIQSANIIASGKMREVTFGFFNSETKVYDPRTISAGPSQKGLEVVSMIGSLARKKDSEPFPHIHASVRTATGEIEGGHFLAGKADSLKVLVITDPQLFYRTADPAVYGANVFQLAKPEASAKLKPGNKLIP
jgi:predicted DNA-binding protein with PD1-like motif